MTDPRAFALRAFEAGVAAARWIIANVLEPP